jgi:hypothetical protein
MRKVQQKYFSIALSAIMLVGIAIAYYMERNRINRFCESIEVNEAIAAVIKRSTEQFGLQLMVLPGERLAWVQGKIARNVSCAVSADGYFVLHKSQVN